MSRYGAPRDNTPRPFEGYPAYGAVHDVLPNQDLRNFLNKFASISDEVFSGTLENSPILIVSSELESEAQPDTYVDDLIYDPRKYYRIFNPETLGVSVVDMDPSARHARAMRTVWEGHDFGAVEQEARNAISRLPQKPLTLCFDRVQGDGHRLPGVPDTEVRKKLALMPKATGNGDTEDVIDKEAGIIVNAIRKRLKQFVYPWDTIPHLTYTVFKREAEPQDIDEVVRATNEHLLKKPLTVSLGRLDFRSKKKRKGR